MRTNGSGLGELAQYGAIRSDVEFGTCGELHVGLAEVERMGAAVIVGRGYPVQPSERSWFLR